MHLLHAATLVLVSGIRLCPGICIAFLLVVLEKCFRFETDQILLFVFIDGAGEHLDEIHVGQVLADLDESRRVSSRSRLRTPRDVYVQRYYPNSNL